MAKKKPASARKPKTKRATKPTRKPAAKAAEKRVSAKSIDGLMKAFDKERGTLNTKLVAGRKKIQQMTKKIASLKAELEATKREVVQTELSIETLDARRDKEIGTLLAGLGVDLGKAAAAAKPKAAVDRSTPLFDKKPAADNGKASKSDKK